MLETMCDSCAVTEKLLLEALGRDKCVTAAEKYLDGAEVRESWV